MSGLIFCMVMMEMWVVAKTSALTLSVAGTLKEVLTTNPNPNPNPSPSPNPDPNPNPNQVLTIACAEEVFHEHLSYVNMLGLLLCIPAGCKGLGFGLGLGSGLGLGLGLLCLQLVGKWRLRCPPRQRPGRLAGLPRGPRARLRAPGCSPGRSEAAEGAMQVRLSVRASPPIRLPRWFEDSPLQATRPPGRPPVRLCEAGQHHDLMPIRCGRGRAARARARHAEQAEAGRVAVGWRAETVHREALVARRCDSLT